MNNEDGKSKEVESLLEALSSELGNPRSEAFANKTCVICGGPATEFRDNVSEREYKISGACQHCQDTMFD